MNPTVSVLMPVWRPQPEFFRQAVESLLAQTLEDWELVIVEDPSDQSAAQLLKTLADARIQHHVNARRTSIVDQLNAGLAHCRADLVARFDADDICHRHRLERQVEFLRSHRGVSVLGTQLTVIDDSGNEIGQRGYPRKHDDIMRLISRCNPLAHPSVMFRRQVILDAGSYRGVQLATGMVPWCQDYELWSRLAAGGTRFANHADALVAYRLHAGQVKTANLRDVIRAQLQIKTQYWRSTMDWRARCRMLAERCLLCLPPRVVVALFQRLEIRASSRARK